MVFWCYSNGWLQDIIIMIFIKVTTEVSVVILGTVRTSLSAMCYGHALLCLQPGMDGYLFSVFVRLYIHADIAVAASMATSGYCSLPIVIAHMPWILPSRYMNTELYLVYH